MQIAAIIWPIPKSFLHDCLFCVIGKDTPIDEMVDFIVAAQLAEKYAEESEDSLDGAEINEEDEDVTPVTARGPEVFGAFLTLAVDFIVNAFVDSTTFLLCSFCVVHVVITFITSNLCFVF
jgi:hypothetical protein